MCVHVCVGMCGGVWGVWVRVLNEVCVWGVLCVDIWFEVLSEEGVFIC